MLVSSINYLTRDSKKKYLKQEKKTFTFNAFVTLSNKN